MTPTLLLTDEDITVVPRLIKEAALEGTIWMHVRHGNVWKDQGMILATEREWHKEYWLKQRGVTGVMFSKHRYTIGYEVKAAEPAVPGQEVQP